MSIALSEGNMQNNMKNGDMRLTEVHMVGQERAIHTAAECSVGEDTHVQISHCLCPYCREGQKCTQCNKKGQRCTNELCTGNTGTIKLQSMLKPNQDHRGCGGCRSKNTLQTGHRSIKGHITLTYNLQSIGCAYFWTVGENQHRHSRTCNLEPFGLFLALTCQD